VLLLTNKHGELEYGFNTDTNARPFGMFAIGVTPDRRVYAITGMSGIMSRELWSQSQSEIVEALSEKYGLRWQGAEGSFKKWEFGDVSHAAILYAGTNLLTLALRYEECTTTIVVRSNWVKTQLEAVQRAAHGL